MDKRLLDPRRARRAPTAEDRAEQLAPYSEELPVAPPGYATFDRQVARLRGAAPLAAASARQGACLCAAGWCGAVIGMASSCAADLLLHFYSRCCSACCCCISCSCCFSHVAIYTTRLRHGIDKSPGNDD